MRDAGAEPGGRHRLVRALPAVEALDQAAPVTVSPGRGRRSQRSDEVDVDAADDRDPGRHCLLLDVRACPSAAGGIDLPIRPTRATSVRMYGSIEIRFSETSASR